MYVTSVLCGLRADLWPFYGFLISFFVFYRSYLFHPFLISFLLLFFLFEFLEIVTCFHVHYLSKYSHPPVRTRCPHVLVLVTQTPIVSRLY